MENLVIKYQYCNLAQNHTQLLNKTKATSPQKSEPQDKYNISKVDTGVMKKTVDASGVQEDIAESEVSFLTSPTTKNI